MKAILEKILMPLIVATVLGIMSLFFDLFGNVSELKSEIMLNKIEHETIKDAQKDMSKKVNAIYWFMIERNNIKLPEKY